MDNDQYLNRFDRLNIKRYFFLLIQRNYLKFFNIIYKYIFITYIHGILSRDNKYIKLMYKNIN